MSITIVFFIYGLAFFSMGIVMLLESGQSPLLVEAKAFLPLALFGFIHGIHEWLEMLLINQELLILQPTTLINWFRISVLAVSFILLFVFSLQVLRPDTKHSNLETTLIIAVVLLYSALVIISTLISQESHADWFSHVDALTRYFLAVPAAFLAGLAFIRKGSQAKKTDQSNLGTMLWLVAFGFICYAITQTFVSPTDTFPGNIWNIKSFMEITGIPIQGIRAIIAIIITVGLLRASQVTAKERKKRLDKSENERLEALQRVRVELDAKEKLRSELMRRTVIAQEEERARIARELHDETSQLLAAISLHLESLRKITQVEDINNQVDELQELRRRISAGIYRLMHDLRPSQLDDLGLTSALRALIDDCQKHLGLSVDMQVYGQEKRLDPFVETVLFRVAQESLTNVARHAGVSQAKIDLFFAPGNVEIRIKDQGRGFSTNGEQGSIRGLGLAGMRERVEAVNGRIRIQSYPSKGTLIRATVPVAEDDSNILIPGFKQDDESPVNALGSSNN